MNGREAGREGAREHSQDSNGTLAGRALVLLTPETGRVRKVGQR
jgi:hypothetical protein